MKYLYLWAILTANQTSIRGTDSMNNLYTFYNFLDLAGTFAFAVSGAVAAKQRRLDLFGILAIAFTVACGGGIIRDLCIGAIPPAGLSDWRYLVVSVIAALAIIRLDRWVERLNQPVLFFDAIGLSFFAVAGARKAMDYGHNAEVAVLLGMVTAVGGGILRDVLLNRIPVVLEKEIYASAALLGAVMVVGGTYLGWSEDWVSLVAICACFGLRFLALRHHWNLPVFQDKNILADSEDKGHKRNDF